MRRLTTLALGACMALATMATVSSCGEAHTAKSHAKEFMEGQMAQAGVDYITW